MKEKVHPIKNKKHELFQNNSGPFLKTDSDLRITKVHPMAEAFFKKKLLGKLVHKIFKKTPPQIIQKLHQGTVQFEEKIGKTMLRITVSRDLGSDELCFYGMDMNLRNHEDKSEHENGLLSEMILNTIQNEVSVIDKECNIVFLNKAFQDLVGDKSIGQKCFKVFKDNKKQCKDCPCLKHLGSGKSRQLVVEGILGGKIFEITHTPIDLPNGTHAFIEDFRDITGQKKAEDIIIKSEEKYRKLYQETPIMMSSINAKGKLIDVNGFWLKNLGYTRGEVIGRKSVEFLTKESKKYAQNVVMPLFFKKGAVKDVLYQMLKKNGEGLDVLLSASSEKNSEGILIKSLAVIKDVTKQNKAESELEASRERYKQVYNNLPVAYQSLNGKGDILDVNPKWLKDLGYKREEVIGKNFEEFIAEDFLAVFRTNFPRFKRDGAVYDIAFNLKKKDGDFISVEYNGQSEYDKDGKFSHTHCIFQDITIRKRAEEELRSVSRFPSDSPHPILRIAESFQVLYANNAAKVLLRNKEPSVEDKILKEFKPIIQEVLKTNKKKEIEHRIEETTFSFTMLPLKKEGYVNIYGKDITEIKTVERGLAESQEKYIALIENIKEPIYSLNIDGEFLFVNSHAAEVLGKKPDNIVGSSLWDIFPQEIADRQFSLILKAASTKRSITTEAISIVEGEERWYATTLWPKINLGGEVEYVQAIAHDVTEEREAQESIKESEDKFHSLFSNAMDGIMILDFKGKLVHANSSFAKMHGYTIDEVLKLSIKDLDTPESAKRIPERIRNVKNGNSMSFITEHYHKAGHSFELEVSIYPIMGQYIVGFHRDITERKRTEAIHFKLNLAIQHSQEVIFMTDKEGIITFINPEFTKMYGFTQEEVIGKVTPRIFKNDSVKSEEYIPFWNTLLNKQGIPTAQYVNKRKDGNLFDVEGSADPILDEEGEIIGFLGIHRDITERRRSEEAIKSSEKLLDKSQQIAKLGSYALDTVSGEWTSSATLNKILGISSKYKRSISSWFKLVHPDDRAEVEGYFNNEVLREKKTFNKEYRIRTLNTNKTRWIQGLGELDFDGNGNLISMIGTVQDITSRKAIEDELNSTLENLESRVKNRTRKLDQAVRKLRREASDKKKIAEGLKKSVTQKNILLNEISHRVKNNLQVIASLINLQIDGMEDESAREAFKETTYRIKSMALIHESLYHAKDFSKMDFGTYVRSLTNYVSNYFVSSDVDTVLGIRNINLSIDSATTCGLVLIELITNSYKYAFPKNIGKIKIEVEYIGESRYVIYYSDNGIGFKPSFNFMESDTLGLELVHGLVHQLNGTVELLEGKGVRIKIQITDK